MVIPRETRAKISRGPSHTAPDLDWQALLALLPPNWEALAEQHKQLEVQYGNAKITTAEQLLRLFFLRAGVGLPLRQAVVLFHEGGGPKLSPMRLHMKLKRAEPYLAALVGALCEELKIAAAPELWGGYRMKSVDATVVNGPGATGTETRIHTVINLSTTTVDQVEVTTYEGGETLRRFEWECDDLVIGDRGYANPAGVQHGVDAHADVLVRVNRAALPLYDNKGAPIDILAHVRSLRDGEPNDLQAFVHPSKRAPLEGRLLAVRLPEKEAAAARKRVLKEKRDKGAVVTDDALEMAAYVVLFTTAPSHRLSAKRCLEAYRLRWQVELKFKRWKTITGLDKLPNRIPPTQITWLLVKILLGMLIDKLASSQTAPLAASRPSSARSEDSRRPDRTRDIELSAAPSGARFRSSSSPMARQPWKMTTILWPLVVSAILPITLFVIGSALCHVADALTALDDVTMVRQVPTFMSSAGAG